ncbi:SCP-like protein [Ancylostoma caninum]|uniref:SCP-like protein n=1 Tax=Ancylostoma caninum TaxID=29170 RepID=A0A368G010_ANCCA|nr:SCP-like protein [Ancylostoma caninum]
MASSTLLVLLVCVLSVCNAALYRRKRATFACSNTGLTDAIRQVFLSYHNDARLRVAKGIEPNNVGNLNPAKNMYKLEWDCAMEKQAQDAIAACPSSLGSWQNMAQNLMRYTSTAGFSNPSIQINSTLNSWWGRAKQYGVTDPQNKYTNGNLYTFANRLPGHWNFFAETNNQCSANSGMTDSVRQTFLSMHNNFRSSVARGLEPDALGGNAPKAAKMLKMVYDCSVEASALKHAKKCVYQHSTSADRPGLGENLYMTSAVNYDKVKAATQASQMWWDELKQYGVGPSNNLTTALWNRPNTQIGHYSQMAWETSYRLGCAVAHCSTFTLGVCQYGPAGNYLNRLIYTIGNPCTSNAGCPGTYTCNVVEGLCNVV